MKLEGEKEPEVDFTQLAGSGNAPVKGQTHSQRISHVKMSSGEWVMIVIGSFNLYKTSDGVPFVEFKVEQQAKTEPFSTPNHKTIQLFPATVAGWAFTDE